MPVVHVRSPNLDATLTGSALELVATRLAEAVPCEVDDVWCTLQPIAVATIGARRVEDTGGIVFVDVWLREREDAEASTRSLTAACHAVSDAFEIPLADVWGALHPVRPRHVFAGGELLS